MANCELIVVEEIGKIELWSPQFQEAVRQIIESGRKMLGTIMLAPHPRAEIAIKLNRRVNIIEVTRTNLQSALAEIRRRLQETPEDNGGE